MDLPYACSTNFFRKRIEIITRIKDLKIKAETQEAQTALSLIESFFTTPNAKIYKMIYHVSDIKKRTNRGTVKPYFVQVNDVERNKVATDAQLGDTSVILSMASLSLSAPQQRTFDHTTEDLKRFMEVLYPKYTPELWQLLAEKYPREYAEWIRQ